MRAPTLVCALASSIVFASGVASAQEPTPAPSSPSNWFDPAPADQKKPSESKPADAADTGPPADAATEAPKAEPEKAKVPERPVEAAGSRVRKRPTPEPSSDQLVWRPEMSRPKTNIVAGGGFGFVSGRFSHPNLYGTSFTGVLAGVHAGVQVNPAILIGIDFDAYRTTVEYLGENTYGYKGANNPRFLPPGAREAGGVRLTGSCTNCKQQSNGGGIVVSGPVNVLTLGPRLQFSANPSHGLYGAVTGGFTFLEGVLKNQTGMSIGARGGYRFALSEQVGLGLEVGTTAHRFEKTTSTFGFGGLQLQLRM